MYKDNRITLSLGVLLIVFSIHGQAQSTFSTFNKQTPIVVRFKKSAQKIALLQKQNHKKALALQAEMQKEREEYVSAFKDIFTYCPVYFMYTDASVALLDGQRSGFLLDQNLMIDSSIVLPTKTFLIADIGTMDHHHMGLDCLYLRDEQLQYPKQKFPYYVKRDGGSFIGTLLAGILGRSDRRPPNQVVTILQKKIENR